MNAGLPETRNRTALEFSGITKSFFGITVLKGVSARLREGHTLGLVGENGAGKSTLMNILGGVLQPDTGVMKVFGEVYAPESPRDATQKGIGFIHQELNLFPTLSVAENIFITSFPRAGGSPFIKRSEMRSRAAALLAEVGLDLSPETFVENLSAGERQLVEIAKALGTDARLLIFDEPTTSLSRRETERLFELLKHLKDRHISTIYISHNLADILRLSDDILVLRDGNVAGEGPRTDFDSDRLISQMVGRELNHLFPERQGSPGRRTLLEARKVSQPGVLHNVSFSLQAGEVLGVAGLMGSGRSELARILFGLDPFATGTLTLEDTSLTSGRLAERIQRGMAFVTEDRRLEGLCAGASVAENFSLVSLPTLRAGFGKIDSAREKAAIGRIRTAVRLNESARDDQPVQTLSGGNQQKVVIGKWLLAEPRVLLLDEPTRGIDVGAKFEIYQLIQELADRGAGILVISSEIEELMGICDRILVMNRGEIRDELPRASFDRERILRSAVHDRSPSPVS